MTKPKSIARPLLTAALLAALATPAFADSFHPNKIIRQEIKEAKAAADAEATAAAAAAQAADKHAAAAEKFAADVRAGKIPPPKGIGDRFSPATVKPYIDNLREILDGLRATTTTAQANAYAPKFKAVLASVETNHNTAIEAYAGAITSGVRTADNNAAEQLISSASGMGEKIEQEMQRVQLLNPALAADFKKFSDLHEQE